MAPRRFLAQKSRLRGTNAKVDEDVTFSCSFTDFVLRIGQAPWMGLVAARNWTSGLERRPRTRGAWWSEDGDVKLHALDPRFLAELCLAVEQVVLGATVGDVDLVDHEAAALLDGQSLELLTHRRLSAFS